jgi:asparagine synthetase B (glutamine-hydrolysing)
MTYQYEPNLALASPLSHWFRCRRGAITKLLPGAGCVDERPVDFADFLGAERGRDDLIEAIRSALDNFGRRQQLRSRAVVELSGGFDSTLAAVAAQKHGIKLLGASIYFPYYEFRFEEGIQLAVAKALSISRTRLDGPNLFPYASPDWWPRLDEPATSVIGLKRDITVARFASNNGLDRVFVGQGGDQLFSEDMLEPLPPPISLARGAFSNAGWRKVKLAWTVMHSTQSFLRRSTLTYLCDARLDVAMKETFGVVTRSPFTDLEMVRCGMSWASLSRRLGLCQGKMILADAFALEFPDVVTGRRGKVCWDGVSARAYALHANSIVNEIEMVRGPLEYLGLDIRWLIRRIEQLAGWEKAKFDRDDKEVFAVYALATWLRSWGIERVSDCGWSD